MTPFDQFKEFYGYKWAEVIRQYIGYHYVYCSPTAIALAKPEGDAWWIEYAAGDVEELLCHLPYWLPYIAYNRNYSLQNSGVNVTDPYKCHSTAKLVNRFLKHDPVKDGHPDAVPRRGRGCSEGEAAETAIPDYGG